MDFVKEDLDFKKILLRRYKSYHLNELEMVAILLIDELNKGVPHLVKAEELEPFMTISSKDIDQIMSRLVKCGYLSLDNKRHCFSIAPLKEKIFKDTIREVYVNESEKKTFNSSQDVYDLVIEAIKRPLTPVEYDTVNSWMIQHIEKEEILQAIEKIKAKRKNILVASIDKEIKLSLKKKTIEISEKDKELLSDLDKDIYGS